MPRHSSVVDRGVEAMSIRFNTRVYELRRQGIPVTVLSLGEAFFDIPLQPFDDLPMPDGYHYSDSRGLPGLREVLTARYRKAFGAELDASSQMLITAGSKAAIHFALQAVLDPGNEVLMRQPCWVSYPEQVRLLHGVPVMLPPAASWRDFEASITDQTRAMIVCNPDNPRGLVSSPRDLRWLIDLARAHDVYLLVDEAYSDFVPGGGFQSAAGLDPSLEHVIVVNSVSKNLGMSGWRIGYVISNSGLIDRVLKINQHVVTCPPTILQHYLIRHHDTIVAQAQPQVRDVVERRNRIAAAAQEMGLRVLPGDATFYMFVSTAPSSLDSVTFATRLLEEERICVVPGVGYGPDCDGWVRVSVGTEEEGVVISALQRLKALADRTAEEE